MFFIIFLLQYYFTQHNSLVSDIPSSVFIPLSYEYFSLHSCVSIHSVKPTIVPQAGISGSITFAVMLAISLTVVGVTITVFIMKKGRLQGTRFGNERTLSILTENHGWREISFFQRMYYSLLLWLLIFINKPFLSFTKSGVFTLL